jgi:hypothetical protein
MGRGRRLRDLIRRWELRHELLALAERYEADGTEFGRSMAEWCREEYRRLAPERLCRRLRRWFPPVA